jgi:hypothetical protein
MTQGVLNAARHSVEKFYNCTDNILFKKSHIRRARCRCMLEGELAETHVGKSHTLVSITVTSKPTTPSS